MVSRQDYNYSNKSYQLTFQQGLGSDISGFPERTGSVSCNAIPPRVRERRRRDATSTNLCVDFANPDSSLPVFLRSLGGTKRTRYPSGLPCSSSATTWPQLCLVFWRRECMFSGKFLISRHNWLIFVLRLRLEGAHGLYGWQWIFIVCFIPGNPGLERTSPADQQ